MDLDTRLEIVKLFYKNNENATATLRAFKTAHGLRHDPFTSKSISNLIAKFENTKSLHDAPRSGRPSLEEQRKDNILNTMNDFQERNVLGHASSTAVSKACDIPKASVCRILKSSGLKPYKISLLQSITELDKAKRLEFAQWILRNQHLLPDILWTDEAYFSVDGLVNRHNCVIWANENPHKMLMKSLHPEKVCVWMAFGANYKLAPFFFDGTVDQNNYTSLLRDHMFPQLRRKRKINNVIFQHDGAPPHFSIQARDFLGTQLPETRVIGRGFGIPWPPRSPDLSPLDYYLWGTLKQRVFHAFRPSNLNELKAKISEEIEAISADELARAVQNMVSRCEVVVEQNGGSIEHLL